MSGVSKPILDAFARFDTDQSGSISRDELAEVLLALDGTWTDESIDQLLCEADSSMDGELQVEEFIRWVFAEDSATDSALGGAVNAVKGAVKDVVLLVAGCSRWEEFDGEYVQMQGMVHGRRPVFYCAELKKYLYYHGKRGQWQIHHKIGNYASCRLKTKRAVHVVGYDTSEVWGVWDSSKKSFVKEPDMGVCICPPPTPEERLEAAPLLAYQSECPVEGAEALGLWRKTQDLLNGRPVYRKMQRQRDGSLKEMDSHLFYTAGRWKICDQGVLEDSTYSASSEETECYSPAKATWKHQGKVRQWTTPNQEDFRSVAPGWHDPDFSEMKMMGVWSETTKQAEYMRALELSQLKSPDGKVELFGDVDPRDSRQGGIGDCWLVAAISGMAEFPNYLRDEIFQTKEIPEDGKYEFKLFDWRSGEWKVITIDDYLPCMAGSLEEPETASTMYAKLPSGKMWAALLEKAIAKLMGGYHALDGGVPTIGFEMMTGCQEHIYHGAPHGTPVPEWKALVDIDVVDEPGGQNLGCLGKEAVFKEAERNRYHVKFTKISGEGPDEGWLPYYVKGQRVAARITTFPWHVYPTSKKSDDEKEQSDDEKIWQKLLQMDLENFPLSTTVAEIENRSEEQANRDGLVPNHAYSFLHAKEACGRRLVCLRNPWGCFEWQGPWNDKGEEWKANPDVAKALQVDLKSDGAFWMEFEDFTWNFMGIMQTKIAMPTKRGGQDELVEVDGE